MLTLAVAVILLGYSPMATAGLGLAAILARVSEVTDSMVEASSLGLAHSLTDEEHALGLLYPRIERSECCHASTI